MSDVTAILDSIDGTLSDCTVSADAMRWAPRAVQAAEPGPAGAAAADVVARAFGRSGAWAAGVLAEAGGTPFAACEQFSFSLTRRDVEQVAATLAPRPFTGLSGVSGTFTGELYPGALERLTGVSAPAQPPATDLAAAARGVLEDIGRVLRPFFDWLAKTVHDAHRALYPCKHKRCATCRPRLKPKPLAVDGHEYRRRQLARRRRKR